LIISLSIPDFIQTLVFQDLTTDLVIDVSQKTSGLYRLNSVASGQSNNKTCISYGSGSSADGFSGLMATFLSFCVSSNNAICNHPSFDVIHARLGNTSLLL